MCFFVLFSKWYLANVWFGILGLHPRNNPDQKGDFRNQSTGPQTMSWDTLPIQVRAIAHPKRVGKGPFRVISGLCSGGYLFLFRVHLKDTPPISLKKKWHTDRIWPGECGIGTNRSCKRRGAGPRGLFTKRKIYALVTIICWVLPKPCKQWVNSHHFVFFIYPLLA